MHAADAKKALLLSLLFLTAASTGCSAPVMPAGIANMESDIPITVTADNAFTFFSNVDTAALSRREAIAAMSFGQLYEYLLKSTDNRSTTIGSYRVSGTREALLNDQKIFASLGGKFASVRALESSLGLNPDSPLDKAEFMAAVGGAPSIALAQGPVNYQDGSTNGVQCASNCHHIMIGDGGENGAAINTGSDNYQGYANYWANQWHEQVYVYDSQGHQVATDCPAGQHLENNQCVGTRTFQYPSQPANTGAGF